MYDYSMKVHTNLSVNDDILKEAKEKGYNLSEVFNAALVRALRPVQKETKRELTGSIKCSWCDVVILDDIYYYCQIHEAIFCSDCATNGRKRVLDNMKGEYGAKCKSNYERIDCILEKREFHGDSNRQEDSVN